MKRTSTTLGFLFLATCAFAQPEQIIYDFNKGVFVENTLVQNGKIKALTTGGFATIKIINVNTFRWKVEINGRSINYVTPIPSELQAIFRLPDQSVTKQKAEQGLQAIITSDQEMKSLEKDVKATEPSIPVLADATAIPEGKARMDSIAANEKKIKDAAVKNANLEKFEKAMETLVKACNEYVVVAQRMANIKFTRIELINVSKQKWENYAAMEEKLPAQLSRPDMLDTYKQFTSYYATAYSLYGSAKDAAAATGDKGAVKRVDDAAERIEEGHKNIYEDNLLALIEDVMVLQEAMQNANYFTVVSPPIQVDGDYVVFTIKTTPTRTNDLMPYEFAKEIPIEIPAKGGWKADFSVGPVVSFGKNARDEKYYIQETATPDIVVFKQRDNNNAISPGLAAMMHFYPRQGKNGALGGLFGVGAGFQSEADPIVSLYAGFSAILGKRQKIMINSGVSYLRVDRLKNKEFAPDKEYPVAKIELANLTEKVFKPSIFFSISYNITNKIDVR